MVNYDQKIEEKQKRLKLIEQEYLMTIGQLKELQENAEKFKNAYIKCMGAIEFLTSEKQNAEKDNKKDK